MTAADGSREDTFAAAGVTRHIEEAAGDRREIT
jgi:hypothetical protein